MKSPASQDLVRSHSPAFLAPALQLSTAQERDSFEFFTRHAISSLRGFVDSPFWQREILQAAHQHESIQHCIVALGAMHRRFFEGTNSHIERGELADHHLQFALRQSNQAIQGLIKAGGPQGGMGDVDKITLMTCSVLFSSMACLQGHNREGLAHLRSGIRMLNEIDQDENSKPEHHPIDIESLRSIFVGLDMQARSIMKGEDIAAWEPLPRSNEAVLSPEAELNDRSILAMQRLLQTLMNQGLEFLQTSAHRDLSDRDIIFYGYKRLLSRFEDITRQLDRLCAKASSAPGDFSQSLLALQLLHSHLEFYLRAPRHDVEARFNIVSDPFIAPFDQIRHFNKMLDLATQLLNHGSHLAPVFTTSMGPLSALWVVATRAPAECPALRKRAVRLMLSYPRREGFWDGLLAGQIAQEILRLEQEATQEELGLFSMPTRDLIVPDDLRIVICAISYDEVNDRKAMVEYSNSRDMAVGRPGSIQWLHW